MRDSDSLPVVQDRGVSGDVCRILVRFAAAVRHARETGWQLAEQAGLDRPYRMPSPLGRSGWDAEALRDKVREEVIDSLGDPAGVLVVDETGFLKKGTHSMGASRHYSGRADRI